MEIKQRKKPLIKLFQVSENDCYMYDTYMNKILALNKNNYSILKDLLDADRDFDEAVLKITDGNFQNFYQAHLKEGFFKSDFIQEIEHPMTDYIEDILSDSIESINLQVTQNCNLRCEYCPYTGNYYNNRTHCNKKMDINLAIKGIEFLFEHSRECSMVNIAFYGGEPLLEFDLIKKCIEYANKKFSGRNLTYSLTTNGILLTDEIMKYFVDNNILLTISLDGPKEVHDRFRVFPNGSGSFELVYNKLKHFKALFKDYYNKNVMFNVVMSKDSRVLEIDEFFSNNSLFEKNEVITTLLSTNYVEHEFDKETEDFVEYFEFEKYKCFLYLLGRIDDPPRRIQLNNLEQLKKTAKELKKFTGIPSKFHPSGPCIPGRKKLFLNVEGLFYPCERINELSPCAIIGDIEKGLNIEQCKTLLNIGKITPNQCKHCWAISQCKSCFIQSDLDGNLCPQSRLKNCSQYKNAILNEFMDLCILDKYNYYLSDLKIL